VDQISLEDLQNTDLYIFRQSNGELIAERRGVPEQELHSFTDVQTGVDEEAHKFFYTLEMRGAMVKSGVWILKQHPA